MSFFDSLGTDVLSYLLLFIEPTSAMHLRLCSRWLRDVVDQQYVCLWLGCHASASITCTDNVDLQSCLFAEKCDFVACCVLGYEKPLARIMRETAVGDDSVRRALKIACACDHMEVLSTLLSALALGALSRHDVNKLFSIAIEERNFRVLDVLMAEFDSPCKPELERDLCMSVLDANDVDSLLKLFDLLSVSFVSMQSTRALSAAVCKNPQTSESVELLRYLVERLRMPPEELLMDWLKLCMFYWWEDVTSWSVNTEKQNCFRYLAAFPSVLRLQETIYAMAIEFGDSSLIELVTDVYPEVSGELCQYRKCGSVGAFYSLVVKRWSPF